MIKPAAFLLSTWLFAGISGALEIYLEESASVASGVQPASQVAWVWVDRRLDDYTPIVTHGLEITSDTNADGQAMLEVPAGISPLSVWVAVDLTTGAVATATPEGFTPPPLPAPGAPEMVAPVSSATQLHPPARIVRALLVRPGAGAWQALGGDGTALDFTAPQN